MNVKLNGHTCMSESGVPLQVPYDLAWKINKKDLKFEIQTRTLIILHEHCRYMVRVL
jgi:hypothetical protein